MSDSSQVTRRPRWPYLSLLPIGLGAWAPIYAGVKARATGWVLLGILWSAIVIAGFAANSVSSSGRAGQNDFAGILILIGWVGAIATSFAIRSAYERQLSSPLLEATEAGRQRLQDRQHALELARQDPALAREIGVGRPDQVGTAHAGLVDVNNASVTALLGLPGVTGELATEIIEMREQIHGFSSLEDVGERLDLPGDLVEALRGEVVFLPRRPPSGG